MYPMVRSSPQLKFGGLFQTSRVCLGCLMFGVLSSVFAQTQQTPGVLQLSAGWQNYSEPQMNLKGPELGLHWQSRNLGAHALEADVQVGLQNYSSVQSGRLDRVLNVDTRWRALRSFTAQPQWQYGLALHTHANFLRGTTSFGFGGYDRLSAQVWLPVRWQSNSELPWSLDAGWLLWGEHLSRLSQVNTSLKDVSHVQRKGAYLQISKKVPSSWGDMEPFLRWAWVDDSNVRELLVDGQIRGAYEPQNNRLQMGVKWDFR